MIVRCENPNNKALPSSEREYNIDPKDIMLVTVGEQEFPAIMQRRLGCLICGRIEIDDIYDTEYQVLESEGATVLHIDMPNPDKISTEIIRSPLKSEEITEFKSSATRGRTEYLARFEIEGF